MITKQQTSTESMNLVDTEKYMARAGMSIEDLNKLNIIHVSGTKGKVNYQYLLGFLTQKCLLKN